jgi:hypothetical protein
MATEPPSSRERRSQRCFPDGIGNFRIAPSEFDRLKKFRRAA